MPVKKTNILTEKMPKMAKKMKELESETPKKKTKAILLKVSKTKKPADSNIEKTQAQKEREELEVIAKQKKTKTAMEYLDLMGGKKVPKYKFDYMSKMPNTKSKYTVQSNEKIENPKEYFEKKEYIENMGKKDKI
jgi:hypothetical protein